MIEKYIHHGVEVSVISEVKGTHRKRCLCHQNCKFFKPNSPDNCPIAQSLYSLCINHNLVTPVFECGRFESKEKS